MHLYKGILWKSQTMNSSPGQRWDFLSVIYYIKIQPMAKQGCWKKVFKSIVYVKHHPHDFRNPYMKLCMTTNPICTCAIIMIAVPGNTGKIHML